MKVNELNRQDLIKDFKRDGYVFVQGFLDQDEIAELKEHLHDFFEKAVPNMPYNHVFYEDDADKSSLKQLQHMYQYDAFFHKLMYDSKFQQLAEMLLGEPVEGKNMQYFNKPPKIGKPTPAHQDGYYFMLEPPTAVTMWLALEKVDEENGCVRYLPGSHKEGYRPHGKTATLGFSQGITDFGTPDDLQRELFFPAEAGDLLVHHALTVHRADGNQSANRTRKALGFIYYGQSARVDNEKHAAYQAALAEEMKK